MSCSGLRLDIAAPAVTAIPFHIADVLQPMWVERNYKLELFLFEWQCFGVHDGDVYAGILVLTTEPLVHRKAVHQRIVLDQAREGQ